MVRTEQQEAVVREMKAYAREVFADGQLPGLVVDLSGNPDADRFVIENPNAFLVAALFDRQISAERAWAAPSMIRDRLGHFDVHLIAQMSPEEIERVIARSPALHRYVATMAKNLILAAKRIVREYEGDAANIWSGNPRVADVIRRFESFDGIGPKIAAMATDILVRELHVPMQTPAGGEVAVDIHVRRVFLRTGLSERDDVATIRNIARDLCPDDPAVLDRPSWLIGRQWCRPTPVCDECRLGSVCPKLAVNISE